MFVEDVLSILARRAHVQNDPLFRTALLDPWYRKFLIDVDQQAKNERPLSTQQARVLLRVLNRVGKRLIEDGSVSSSSLQALLAFPRYRHEPYQSSIMPREVRHVGDNIFAFRFKMSAEIIADIKTITGVGLPLIALSQPRFDGDYKVWLVPVTRDTVDTVFHLIKKHSFQIDEPTLLYLHAALNVTVDEVASFKLDGDHIVGTMNGNEIVAAWATRVLGGEIA